ncbi:NAD(P)H-hydrate dehydratase [Pseudogemmobacter bohemicus]|uniref:NAD(P)H-hydrate dehydratase n=1 Tax=Pseudogemmobacter bohemicus TaxID=2250708 RepID=UPI000DD3C1F3|nr:NAD(P)H-hydrate dehydratase [Pseudogemmobacter bohemicus]
MSEILAGAQMRAVEQAAIASGAVSGLELMERAGQGVVEAILAHWPDEGPRRAVVLCGPGNNGGDGFVIARLLHLKGWRVRVLAATRPGQMPPDAALNARRWWAFGPVEALTERNLRREEAEIFVDAIFGIGLSRPPEGEIRTVLTHLGGRNGDIYWPQIVAVDVPSGLCADSGRSLAPQLHGMPPRVALTVTFDSPKPGHFLGLGPGICGRLQVVDIGVAPWRQMPDPKPRKSGGGAAWIGARRLAMLGQVTPASEPVLVSAPPGSFAPSALSKAGWVAADQTHKFTFGHALVLAGGPGRGGAARLSARAALRVGAGLVTLAPPPDALAENAARLDEVMLHPLPDAGALTGLLSDRRIRALCLGPGLGTGAREAALVTAALDWAPPGEGYAVTGGLMLDADALTILAGRTGLARTLPPRCILTPHGGEFARLFPDIAAKLAADPGSGPAYSKLDAAREAAARAGCVVLLKGPDTVIADQTGRAAIHSASGARAAPWLATAGSGDVLAGLITGLLARGQQPFQAACIAAWLHVESALSFGPGLIAGDLIGELPRVMRRLGL